MVDLLLLNLLTPRITFYFSPFLLSFSPVRSTLGRTEVGSRVKNRCRKNRDDGLAEGEKDRLGRAASNRKRRKGREDKLRFARKADYMCRRFVFANRFQSICDRRRYRRKSLESIPFSEAIIEQAVSCIAHRFSLQKILFSTLFAFISGLIRCSLILQVYTDQIRILINRS